MENTISGYLLSPLQKRIWDSKNENYCFNNLLTMEIDGVFEPDRLVGTLDLIIERHEVFRTTYYEQPHLTYPVQLVEKGNKVSLGMEDLSGSDAVRQQNRLSEIRSDLIVQQFDLSAPNLLGAYLVRLSADQHTLLLYCPLIASDAETMYNLAKELITLYHGSIPGEDDGQVFQFVQYAEWQNEMRGEDHLESMDYWNEAQPVPPPKMRLPLASRLKNDDRVAPSIAPIIFDEKLTDKLTAYLFNTDKISDDFILSCWIAFVWHHLDFQQDILIGKAESGRIPEMFKAINGLMTQILPFYCKPGIHDTIDDLYNNVVQIGNDNSRFQDHYSKPTGSDGDLNIGYEHYRFGDRNFKINDVKYIVKDIFTGYGHFDLKLFIAEYTEGMELAFHYSKSCFSDTTIEIIKMQFIQFVHDIIEYPELPLKDLLHITAHETSLVFNEFNSSGTPFVLTDYTALFEEQVLKTPFNQALVFNHISQSYTELNGKANQVANFLCLEHNISKGDIIAVRLKRSPILISVLLGIMKSGAVFLPIDYDISIDRFQFVLKDSGAKIVLTDESIFKDQLNCPEEVLLNNHAKKLEAHSKKFEKVILSPDDIAYLIYTSGSTGKPKGTLIANKSFTNYLNWVKTSFKINENDSTALFSSVSFDLSYTSLWSVLISGGTLHILEETPHLEPDKLVDLLIQQKITYIKLTPSHFSLITENPALKEITAALSLRLILLGGENIKVADVGKYVKFKKDTRFVNHYGPTETTIGVIFHVLDIENLDNFKDMPVIGKPIPNNKVYILNNEHKLSPIGVTGELCVSGIGVAAGYLKREDLMKDKFIKDPFHPSQVLYKTGDLARWLSNGQIQLIGRNDGQVKIRGYRIETGEIEKILTEDTAIRNAVVLAINDSDDELYLKAFLLIDDQQELDINKLRERIALQLPEYMIPAQFTRLSSFPLLRNGKINNKEILNMNTMIIENKQDQESPRNTVEEQIIAVWQKVLSKEVVSTNESFFNIGGNSLKLVKVFRELSERFPNKLTLTDLFKYSTVEAISNYLISKMDVNATLIDHTENIESLDF